MTEISNAVKQEKKQSREKRMFPRQIIAQEAKQGLMLVLSLGHQIFKGQLSAGASQDRNRRTLYRFLSFTMPILSTPRLRVKML